MRRGSLTAIITVLLAAGAAAGVFLFMRNVRNDASSPVATVDVIVSTQDIAAGQDLDPLIASDVFQSKSIATDDLVQGVITDVYQLRGQRTAYPILAGEQISAARFAGPLQAAGGLLGIPDGYQAGSVTLEGQRVVAGAIHTGDHVEVFGTFASRNGEQTTRAIITDAQVLGVSAPNVSGGGATVTLAVTPTDAGVLIYAQEQGKVWFTLLPPNQAGVDIPVVTAKAFR